MTSKDNGDTKVREARMSEVKQKRNSTIDALRLLCIFLVIESHVYLSFFPRPSADNHAAFGWMVLSCLMCTLMSLNNHGFMAISGYYGVKLNVRKIFGFCYMIWFYSVIGLALSLPGLRSAEGGGISRRGKRCQEPVSGDDGEVLVRNRLCDPAVRFARNQLPCGAV